MNISKSQQSTTNSDIFVLTEDKRLLPAHQVLIPDADWRLPYIDRQKIKILHARVSHSLAANAGSPSLFKNVDERPRREVQPAKNEDATKWCQRWQETLRSAEFEAGLKRLILHERVLDERGLDLSINLKWLTEISVSPASRIVTDLFLNGDCIASDVPGNYYFDKEYQTFYLRCDHKSLMIQYLIESLNNRLAVDNCKLGDRARYLVSILDEKPTDINSYLTNQRIRNLQGELPQIDWQSNNLLTDSPDGFNIDGEGNDDRQAFWEKCDSTVGEQKDEFADDITEEQEKTNSRLEELPSEMTPLGEVTTKRNETSVLPQRGDGTVLGNGNKRGSQESGTNISTSSQGKHRKPGAPSKPIGGHRKVYSPATSVTRAEPTSSKPQKSDDFDYPNAIEAVFLRSGKTKLNPTVQQQPIANPKQRRQKIRETIQSERVNEPPRVERVREVNTVRWESKNEEVRTFLKQVYGGKCQICSYTFPKRDGEPYFEGVYLLSYTHARWIDQKGNVLCLCANCSAKFQHGSVKAENIKEQIQCFRALNEGGQEEYVLSIELCGKSEDIRFHESHMIEFQELLRVAEDEDSQ